MNIGEESGIKEDGIMIQIKELKTIRIGMSEFYDQIFCESNPEYSIVVKDDGRVAYAYLLENNNIIGDIWLYNPKPVPVAADWQNKDEMPFLNPIVFVKDEISPITDSRQVDVKWVLFNNSVLDNVTTYVDNRLIAKLSINSMPGWSALVSKDRPLAQVM